MFANVYRGAFFGRETGTTGTPPDKSVTRQEVKCVPVDAKNCPGGYRYWDTKSLDTVELCL